MTKLIIQILLLLIPLELYAQKEDYNWIIANKQIDFNYNPPKVREMTFSGNQYNMSCISDKNGKYLFRYVGVKLHDANDNIIFTHIGGLMHSPALIPYPYNGDKTLFFYADTRKGICCATINNSNPSEIQDIKIFPRTNSYFMVIQQKNTGNIWHLSSVDAKIEMSLITNDGFSEAKILDLPYNVTDAIVSYDNSKIIFRNNYISVLFDFDNENGILTKLYDYGLNAECVFSKSGDYIYTIEMKDANNCNVVRYNIKNSTDETSLLKTKHIIGQIPTQGGRLKLAPDGNIYISVGNYLYAIYDCDTENAYVKPNVVKFDEKISWMPYTFHYTFDNAETNPVIIDLSPVCASQTKSYSVETPEPNVVYHWTVSGGTADKSTGDRISVKWQGTEGDGKITVYGEDPTTNCVSETITYTVKINKSPLVEFDNAFVCHGQPLSIISSGDAPFEISYTIDGEPRNITTSDTEYQLPDVAGRYKITKIKDASCEFSPMGNNEAEIAPQMKKVKIVEE